MKKRNFLMFVVTIIFIVTESIMIYVFFNYAAVTEKLSPEAVEWVTIIMFHALLILTMIIALTNTYKAIIIALVCNLALYGINFGLVILTENLSIPYGIAALETLILYLAVVKYIHTT